MQKWSFILFVLLFVCNSVHGQVEETDVNVDLSFRGIDIKYIDSMANNRIFPDELRKEYVECLKILKETKEFYIKLRKDYLYIRDGKYSRWVLQKNNQHVYPNSFNAYSDLTDPTNQTLIFTREIPTIEDWERLFAEHKFRKDSEWVRNEKRTSPNHRPYRGLIPYIESISAGLTAFSNGGTASISLPYGLYWTSTPYSSDEMVISSPYKTHIKKLKKSEEAYLVFKYEIECRKLNDYWSNAMSKINRRLHDIQNKTIQTEKEEKKRVADVVSNHPVPQLFIRMSQDILDTPELFDYEISPSYDNRKWNVKVFANKTTPKIFYELYTRAQQIEDKNGNLCLDFLQPYGPIPTVNLSYSETELSHISGIMEQMVNSIKLNIHSFFTSTFKLKNTNNQSSLSYLENSLKIHNLRNPDGLFTNIYYYGLYLRPRTGQGKIIRCPVIRMDLNPGELVYTFDIHWDLLEEGNLKPQKNKSYNITIKK